MKNAEILSALVGLAGAINNGGTLETTDELVRKALVLMKQGEEASVKEMAQKIRKEKFIISPGCETCVSPCGNTSDMPMDKYYQAEEEEVRLKDQVVERLTEMAEALPEGQKLPDVMYKAISYIGYGLAADSYSKLLEEMV